MPSGARFGIRPWLMAVRPQRRLRISQPTGKPPRALITRSEPSCICPKHARQVSQASVFTRVWLVHVIVECGEFAEGIVWGEEALQIAKTVNHPFSILVAYRGLGYLHLRKGSLDEAIRVLEYSGELSKTWDIRPYIA